MTEALRRILWFLPVLAAGAVMLFLALGQARTISTTLSLPLFYNADPNSAEVAANRALALTRLGKAEGAEELVNLGGAALPTITARLSTLSVKERRVIARALVPVAERMSLTHSRSWSSALNATPGPSESEQDADFHLLFWERYADEHSLDLRPLSVSRLVKRMAERDSLLRSPDLMAVDTYALPTMVNMLGRVSTEEDVARCRRLVRMIAHVTEKDWSVAPHASVRETRELATEIRHFWDKEGPRWTSLNRFELLVARLSQTEFSIWIFRSARSLSGLDDRPLVRRISNHGRKSFPLFALALLGLLVVGPLAAATVQVLQLGESRWKLERYGLRAGMAAGLMALLPLLVAQKQASLGQLAFAALLTGTAFSGFILHRELNDRLDWRTHHVLRSRPWQERVFAVGRWLAPSLPTLMPMAVAEAALWVTCLEASSQTKGLGYETLKALSSGDIYFLMATCLGLGLTTGIAQVLADLLLGTARWRQGEV